MSKIQKQARHDGGSTERSKVPEEPIPPLPPAQQMLPEIWGYGLHEVPTGWLACRLSTRGAVEVLNPKRHGEYRGETKALATARMMEALRQEYGGGGAKLRRFKVGA